MRSVNVALPIRHGSLSCMSASETKQSDNQGVRPAWASVAAILVWVEAIFFGGATVFSIWQGMTSSEGGMARFVPWAIAFFVIASLCGLGGMGVWKGWPRAWAPLVVWHVTVLLCLVLPILSSAWAYVVGPFLIAASVGILLILPSTIKWMQVKER